MKIIRTLKIANRNGIFFKKVERTRAMARMETIEREKKASYTLIHLEENHRCQSQ